MSRRAAVLNMPMVAGFLALLLQGCAGGIQRPLPDHEPADDATTVASRAAEAALSMVGRPYVYGGASPSSGFDCSGLVQFAYKQAGWNVPRSTEEQRRRSRLLGATELRRGDLLFFDQDSKKNSHVALYLGEGRFVHAPSGFKATRTDTMGSPYWRRHFSEARRIEAAGR